MVISLDTMRYNGDMMRLILDEVQPLQFLFYIKIDVSIINGLKEADRATPICRLYQAVNTSNNQKVEHTICLCLAGLPLTKPHSVSISSRHQTCPACFSGLTSEVRLHGAEASAQESQCRAQLDTSPTDPNSTQNR